jgi:drug/metabolite transporter (DMT)-like permease
MSREWLNVIGLSLGILGVLMIFVWGPPQPSFERGVGLGLEAGNVLPDGKTVAEHDRETEAKERFTTIMSRIGLSFILFGFIVQLIGSWPNASGGSAADKPKPAASNRIQR